MSRVLNFWREETGVVKDFAGATAPAGYLMCYGQAVSRATYSTLFDVIGTTFGAGDGSTTFNVPDARGRVAAGKDNMGGVAAARLNGAGATLGGAMGAQTKALSVAEMPQHNHGVTDPGHGHGVSDPTHAHGSNAAINGGGSSTGGGGFALNGPGAATISAAATGISIVAAATGISTQNTGTGTAFDMTQPTLVLNKIIKT